MSAHVLLDLLNELGKRGKMRGLPSILSLFRNEFNSNQPPSVGSRRLPTRELVAFTIRHAFFSDIPHPLLHTRP